MNPLFWFLVLLLVPAAAWVGGATYFKRIGKRVYRTFENVEKTLNEDEEEKEV